MACTNFNSNTQPRVQFTGSFPVDFCFDGNWGHAFEAFRDALAATLPDNYSTFLISDSTPAASDRDKVWVSVDATNCRPKGLKLYLNGEWVDVGARVFYGVDVSSTDNLVQVDSTSPNVNWAETGQVFFVKFARSNTGAVTANIKNGATTFYSGVPIRKHNNLALTELDIIPGMTGVLVYDGVTNTLVLTNPRTGSSSSSGSATASTASTNLSFDIDSDANGFPDGWSVFTGGQSFTGTGSESLTAPNSGTPAFTLDASDGVHGGKSVKFVCTSGTGNGGGFIQSSAHIEIVGGKIQEFSWWVKTTADDIANRVEILWYDKDKAYLSKTELWFNNASNPNGEWYQHGGIAESPATARYCKVRLIAGVSGSPGSGSVWFDDFRFEAPTFTHFNQVTSGAGATFKWMCPAGVYQIKAQAVGGGAGGGKYTGSTALKSAGGGGSGGSVIAYLPTDPGVEYDITIGVGGATEADGGDTVFVVGSCTLTGSKGVKGGSSSSSTNASGGTGGAASVTSWGVTIPGQDGLPVGNPAGTGHRGYGGNSSLGAGGGANQTNGIGQPGSGFGSGGGGGWNAGSASLPVSGGAGAQGTVIIQYNA